MGNAKSPGMFPTPIEEKIVESCDLEIAIPEIRILIELISINRINHKKKKTKKLEKGDEGGIGYQQWTECGNRRLRRRRRGRSGGGSLLRRRRPGIADDDRSPVSLSNPKPSFKM